MGFNPTQQQDNNYSTNLYLGAENFYVVGVNPSTEWLKENGFPYMKEGEPNYNLKDEAENINGNNITFYLRSVSKDENGKALISTRVSFPLNNFTWSKKDDSKYQIIDKRGRTTWITGPDDRPDYNINSPYVSMLWTEEDFKSARKAYRGEDKLTDFLKVWLNIENKNGGEARFEEKDILALTKGDTSCLQPFFEQCTDNKVKFILNVTEVQKDDKTNYYQGVFNVGILRHYAKKAYVKPIENFLENSSKEIHCDLEAMELLVFDPTALITAESQDDEDPWTTD